MTTKYLTSVIAVGVTLALSFGVSAQMHVDPDGKVGFGTVSPAAGMHVKRSDGTAQILVEESNGTQMQRDLFVIKNYGNPQFHLINTANDNNWSFMAGLNFVIRNNASDRLSVLSPTGDLTIMGSITTAGSTCGGGCDLVFDPETKIESIDEHASLMWTNSYLPAVGPTVENEPFNITAKTGGMLNELEKAHIYIEQLHKRLAMLETAQQLSQENTILVARVAKLQGENRALAIRQQNQYAELKAMVNDLRLQSQSRDLLVHLD